jgi:hypothetical protein
VKLNLLNHRGNMCSFEAIIADFDLKAQGLARLAFIVRAADVKGQGSVAAEQVGQCLRTHCFHLAE